MCDNKDNIEAVENMDHENGKDPDNDKTEEEMSESGETTSSTTESDVSDVEMDSNNEDPFAWDKQVKYCISYLEDHNRNRSSFSCLIALDVGRTLPNTDLSRDFMGLVDLGTHIWHPPQIFLQGRMTSQKRESLESRSSNALHHL